jgi:hypothetical protein
VTRSAARRLVSYANRRQLEIARARHAPEGLLGESLADWRKV